MRPLGRPFGRCGRCCSTRTRLDPMAASTASHTAKQAKCTGCVKPTAPCLSFGQGHGRHQGVLWGSHQVVGVPAAAAEAEVAVRVAAQELGWGCQQPSLHLGED